MAYKGIFTPTQPDKYRGNPGNIIYRSTWELRVMRYLDGNRNVIWWSSEEVFITYISPIDGRPHKYYPDFVFHVVDSKGKEATHMWEVKPHKQTKMPQGKRKTKKFLMEYATYEVNLCKWTAAKAFCDENNWKFNLITEEDLFKRG